MTGRPTVFAGPSLHGVDPKWFEGVEVRPPAACGDILATALSGATVIGLIDGVFENAAAVWHKEILYALSSGVAVFGASSMGALRAAECATFGMVGVGTVYNEYATGVRVADSDVAVVHAPAEMGFLPLTVALVDAEATIAAVRQREGNLALICDRLVTAARLLSFTQRSWANVVAAANLNDVQSSLAAEAIKRNERSIKREDAQLLLELLPTAEHRAGPPTPISWRFERTAFFETLQQRVSQAARARIDC
jgi:hypothetical protein